MCPWLNGKPYYCALCGLGGGEYAACEEGDCQLESEDIAKARAVAELQLRKEKANVAP